MNKNLAVFTALLFAISFVSAQTYPAGCWGMMGGAYGYGFGFIFGWIFMALVLVALVLLIIWLANQISKDNKRRR